MYVSRSSFTPCSTPRLHDLVIFACSIVSAHHQTSSEKADQVLRAVIYFYFFLKSFYSRRLAIMLRLFSFSCFHAFICARSVSGGIFDLRLRIEQAKPSVLLVGPFCHACNYFKFSLLQYLYEILRDLFLLLLYFACFIVIFCYDRPHS